MVRQPPARNFARQKVGTIFLFFPAQITRGSRQRISTRNCAVVMAESTGRCALPRRIQLLTPQQSRFFMDCHCYRVVLRGCAAATPRMSPSPTQFHTSNPHTSMPNRGSKTVFRTQKALFLAQHTGRICNTITLEN